MTAENPLPSYAVIIVSARVYLCFRCDLRSRKNRCLNDLNPMCRFSPQNCPKSRRSLCCDFPKPTRYYHRMRTFRCFSLLLILPCHPHHCLNCRFDCRRTAFSAAPRLSRSFRRYALGYSNPAGYPYHSNSTMTGSLMLLSFPYRCNSLSL